MKKVALTLTFILMVISGIDAMSLREAFDSIAKLPNLPGVSQGISIDVKDGWLNSLPLKKAMTVYKVHEVGSKQTIYYGSKIANIVNKLPQENLVLSSTNQENLFYIYASKLSDNNYEILILIDMAYPGKTTAVIGEVEEPIINALKKGRVTLSRDEIKVEVPLLICK